MRTVSSRFWLDDEAQEAGAFYMSLFPNSRIIDTKYYREGAPRTANGLAMKPPCHMPARLRPS